MKEKVFYVELPEGAKFRGVRKEGKVAVGIVYSLEENQKNHILKPKPVIPKPDSLLGGSEVYQKDGVPYWYCRIKDGRDEFVCLYTDDLTVDDVFFDYEGKRRKFGPLRSQTPKTEFRDYLLKALHNKPKKGYVWLPVCSPSLDDEGGLQFIKDGTLFIQDELEKKRGDCLELGYGGDYLDYLEIIEKWEEKIKQYSPENGSKIASEDIYFLLILRWMKDGWFLKDDVEKLAYTLNDRFYWNVFNGKEFGDDEFDNFGGMWKFIGYTGKILKCKYGGYTIAGSRPYDFPIYRQIKVQKTLVGINTPILYGEFCQKNTVALVELEN